MTSNNKINTVLLKQAAKNALKVQANSVVRPTLLHPGKHSNDSEAYPPPTHTLTSYSDVYIGRCIATTSQGNAVRFTDAS